MAYERLHVITSRATAQMRDEICGGPLCVFGCRRTDSDIALKDLQ